jgi:hexosaminidase
MLHEIQIIPKPGKVIRSAGVFELKASTRILVSNRTKAVGDYLQGLFHPATGYPLTVEQTPVSEAIPDSILLTTAEADPSLGEEGYTLTVSPTVVVIRAPAAAGVFHGLQTLRQLLPPQIGSSEKVSGVQWTVPALTIEDQPRFQWRGMMLDVGRHLFPVPFIKRYIDLMALHKMNVFHWHLTEDQGWRIEIQKYPRLTQVGAWRTASPLPGEMTDTDDQPYGGYYTQDQIREVVAYAASRFIQVVPEIEVPGHALAALASYPELGCTGGPYAVWTNWGIQKDVFCAGNEAVFTFLENVLEEVLDLFPSKFIHIGGDECPKDRWKTCPKCQAAIRDHGLKDEAQLQSYVIQRIEKYLNSHGRRMIGWDEILEGGLAPNAAVMSWRGMEGGLEAVKQGHDVVMSPTSHCYLDYRQTEAEDHEFPDWMAYTPLEKVYALEPVPADLSSTERTHVLGVQGNLWSEFLRTPERAETMAYPRASALAEVMWSEAASRDFGDFSHRLETLLAHLEYLNVHFWKGK